MSDEKKYSSWEEAVESLRRQPDKLQLVRDCYYDDPLIVAAQRYWQSEEWGAIRSLLAGASGSALDVGAGRGIASYAMARDGFAVTALEPDPSDIVGGGAIRGLAQEAGLNIRVVEEFSERLPFPDGTFDVVFARAVLHHTRDLEGACREFMRVLKPGGRLIAVREHVISRPEDLPKFFEIHPLHHLYGGENAFQLGQYVAALERAGFAASTVLTPWRSPVNFAPYSLSEFQGELAKRISLGIPGMRALLRGLLAVPGVWPMVSRVMEYVDHRPGRLYSFVANKPR
ncbi:class I SAM-dependent methyltransferase [Ferriphaselus sp. R-1]|uniref:class I SAM-dependent methyltransferase n=1 Tax=Ferriphaselus sp. R-1 TaxID=1485544 RepID=UPI00054EBDD9|nr:class I SAM-dependent methyltransferase [Ferriphaselus sp. R-1]